MSKPKPNPVVKKSSIDVRKRKNGGNERNKDLFEELYKKFMACEPDCNICGKYILDFSHHFHAAHRQTSDDPLPFTIDYVGNSSKQIKRNPKRKSVAVQPDCFLNIYHGSINPNSDKTIPEKQNTKLKKKNDEDEDEDASESGTESESKVKNIGDTNDLKTSTILVKSEPCDQVEPIHENFEDLRHLANMVVSVTLGHQDESAAEDNDPNEDVDPEENIDSDEDFPEPEDQLSSPHDDVDSDADSGDQQRPGLKKVSHDCNLCPKKFSTFRSLKEHKQKRHGDQIEKPRFVCGHCDGDVRFYSAKKLCNHVHTNHPGEKPYICSTCQMGFDKKGAFDNHILKHTGEKPIECPVCKKRFRNKRLLRVHSAIHRTEKRFPCDECEKSFHFGSALNEHKRTVHTRGKRFMCDVCSQCFYSIGFLNAHMSCHGERSHMCEHCGKSFKRATHLAQHVLTHTGEKSHQCEVCGKFFRLVGTLRLHVKRVHKVDQLNVPVTSEAK